jgi:cell division protein FtsW (lipid II flippase)
MMFAALILLCLAAALVCALAVRTQRLPGAVGVLAALLVPLGAWLAMQMTSVPARSPLQFEVLGQYHRLSDTLRIAALPTADVVLTSAAAAAADVTVSFDAASEQLHVQVHRADAAVLLGARPVNAVALRRRNVLRSAAGDSVVMSRPWFCFRCDTRYVHDADGRRELRLGTGARVAVGSDTVLIFRIRGTAYASADPASEVQVNGNRIPATLAGAPDTLHLGWPSGERMLVMPVPDQHRLDIRFADAARARWVLPQPVDDSLSLMVSATAGEPLPGTMRVLDPAAAAPGAAREPYGGVLALRDGAWSWLANGSSRAFAADVPELLPGPSTARRAGHIVQIRRYDMDPARARAAVLIAWLLGAGTLAWLWRHLHPEAAALRTALLGAIYTLVAVRGIVAFRAWLAPPHDVNSPQTFIALLLAIPALIAVLHLWSRAAAAARPEQLRREIVFTAAPLLVALSAVTALVLPGWRAALLQTVLAAVILGAAGLALLNRMLLGRAPDARLRDPLAAATAPAMEGYTYRQFLQALVLLAVLGFLLIVIMQLLRYGTLLAFAAWGLILGGALLVASDPGVLIRRRSDTRAIAVAAAVAIASAAVAWALQLGIIVGTAAFLGAGTIAWLLARTASFRVRPVRIRALLVGPLAIAVAASLAAVLLPDVIGALRVTAEYALALAGLIAIARIFSILWFRHTHRLTRAAAAARARRPLPGGVAVGIVLTLLVAAVYAPLALFDQGLVLLFLAATVAAIAIGFHTIGARTLAAVVPVAVLVVFFLGMFVRPSSLADGSASLNTAQIRYAATYHPRELQRHLLTSDDAHPITTVRTLQQYWGISHFAAGGTTGRGYFGSGYADWIVPRPVALTENVFSTFVLSEHGWAGGVAVLLAYLAIALALLYGAWRTTDRSATSPRALLLAGIAAFWLVPALYIAGANGLVLPLTGQNMPMLGLLSRADVALACWLTAIGVCALPGTGSSGIEHTPTGGWVGRLRSATAAVAAIFAIATLALGVLLWKPTHAQVGDFALDGVIADVDALVAQGALHVVRAEQGRDSIGIAGSAAAHPWLGDGGFMRSRVRRANSIARGEPAGAGCLDSDALLRTRDDGTIAVFGALCGIRAVARTSHAWTGSLVTAADVSEFVLSDGRSAVVLDPDADDTGVIGPCAPAGARRANAVRIGCAPDAPLLRFGTSAPVLETTAAGATLNGAAAQVPTLIRHGDHLRAAGTDAWAHELPRGALAYARWENDAQRRIAHSAGAPWLAQIDTQLARGMATAERSLWNAEVTLLPALHGSLHDRLAAACADVPGVRRCSALIADPHTGAILALAATSQQPHRFLPADPNLRNHPAASAIKPILAAAALHAFPALATLEVEHAGAEYAVVANTDVQPSLRAPRSYPAPRVPLRGYLGASDNLYSATLGFLATSDRAADGSPALRGQQDQSRLALNGRSLRGQPSWAGGSLDLGASPLATSLRQLFGVHVDARSAPAFESAFWQPAIDAGALIESGELQRITPEPVALRMDAFRSPRELTSFTIGGDRNRWNNIALVQAMSRIYTGRAVQLHLLRAVDDRALEYTAPEIDGFDVRRVVLDGMEAVTQEPWGTAYALRTSFAPAVGLRAKTGTLREREWVGSVFLYAGGPASGGPCPAAGIVTVEFAQDANPDGAATAVFRDAIAPLLRGVLGWNGGPCEHRAAER